MSPKSQPTPATPLTQLHDYLSSHDYDVPADPKEFPDWVQQDGRLERLHKVLLEDKDGAEVAPDYKTFEGALFAGEDAAKKKAQDLPVSGNAAGDGSSADKPVGLTTPPDTLALPQEQVIPASFTGPRPAGSYEKRDDTGTVAEGTAYISPASRAGQLNPVAGQAAPTDDTFLSALGKGIANIPGDLVHMGGNALDYLGDFNQKFLTPKSDVAPGYEDEVGVVTNNKPSDKMGAAMRDQGEAMKYQVSANAKKSVLDEPTNGAAWGNLLGQGVNSVVTIGAASAVGGPLAGVTVGGAMGVSATKDAAREAGLSETEAMYTATALAPIQGALEELGMGFITKNKAVTGLLTKTLIGRALADGGGKLSETALAKAVAKLLPEVVKRGLKGGSGEAVTEFLQGEAEGIAKLTADKLRGNSTASAGKGRYGISVKDALIKQPLEQAVGGLLVGGIAGSAFHGQTDAKPAEQAPEQPAPVEAAQPPVEAPAAPAAPTPESAPLRAPDFVPYAPVEGTRTVSIGEAGDGTPMFADVTPEGKAVNIHNGQEQMADVSAHADVMDADYSAAPTVEAALSTPEQVQPGVTDITSQAPVEMPLWQRTRAEYLANRPNQVSLRDAPTLEDLTRSLKEQNGAPGITIEQPHTSAGTAEMPREQAPIDDGRQLVVMRNQQGKPIGVLEVHSWDENGQGSVTQSVKVAVEPTERGKGIAGQLYAAAEAAGIKVDSAQGEERTEAGAGFRHKQAVEDALAKGLPVPEEVMADYPQLKPTEASTPEPAASEQPVSTESEQPVESGQPPVESPTAAVAAVEELPAGIPDGQKERHHPLHYDEATQAGLTPEQRFYPPRTRIGNAAEAGSFIAEHGLDNAYKFVMNGDRRGSDGNEIEAVVLDEVRGQVRSQLEDASIAAAKAGNPEEAARLLGQSINALGQRAIERTKAAQVLAQYEGDIIKNPEKAKDDFVASITVMKKEAAAKNAKKGKPLDAEATTRRKKTVEAVLTDDAVQAAATAAATQAMTGEAPAKTATTSTKTPADPPAWGSGNKLFTKESIAKAKADLKKLGLSSFVPPELLHLMGFHMEAGARSFAEASKRVLRDVGAKVKPLLADAYEQAKAQMIAKGDSGQGFDGKDGVAAALNKEMGADLADRLIGQVTPVKNAAFDPVKQMLETLVKRVGETLPAGTPKPKEARDALAHAINNRREYTKVLEASKDEVLKKIAESKQPEAVKQQMVDALTNFMEEASGKPYAEQQFRRAVRQAEDAVLTSLPGKDRTEQLDALARLSEPEYVKVLERIQDHVTAGVDVPDFEATEATALRDAVADDVNGRVVARRRAERARKGIHEEGQEPASKAATPPKPLPERIADLFALRATQAQVANRMAPEAITQGIKDLKTTLERLVRQHADVRNAAVESLVDKLVKEAHLTPAQAKEFADVVAARFAELAQTKARSVATRILAPVKAKLPGSKTRTVVDKLSEALDIADATGDNPSPAAALLTKMTGIPDVTVEDIQAFRVLSDKLRVAATAKQVTIKGKTVEVIDTKARDKALTDLLRYSAEKTKSVSFWAKTRALQYAFRLSGLDTQGRNLKANVLHTLMEQGIITPLYNIGRNGNLFGGGAGFKGYMKGQGNGIAEASYTLKTGYAAGPQEKFGDNSPLEVSQNKFLRLAKFVNRLMVGGDQLTSIPTENSRTYEVALQKGYELARTQMDASGVPLGLKGQALRDAAYAAANEILYNTKEAIADIHHVVEQEGLPEITLAEVKAGKHTMGEYTQRAMQRNIRIADLLRQARASDNPDMVNEAQDYARIQTLNGDVQGPLGKIIDAAATIGKNNPVMDALMTNIMPFMKIPANSLLRKMEWGLPLLTAARAAGGRTSLTMREDSKYSRELTKEEQHKLYLRAAVGSAAWAGFGALLHAGVIGITGPARGKDDEDLLHPPMSVWFGDHSFTYKDTNVEYPLTIMAAVADYARKQNKKGVDPTYVKLLTVAAIHSAAWAVTTGPINGPADMGNVLIQAQQGNYETAGSYFKRLLITPVKTGLVPAIVNQGAQAWREYDGQAQRERKSNSLPDELLVSFFGNIPYADIGEDKINVWGDPVVTNRDGMGVWVTDEKKQLAATLVHLNLMPARQAPTDDRLTLFDPSTGDQVTPLSNREFHDYAVARGNKFYDYLTAPQGSSPSLMEQIKEATTFKEASRLRNQALTRATTEALAAIEATRAATGQPASFKLSRDIRNQQDADSFRDIKNNATAADD